MKHYYYYSPRGFCNEAYIISVDQKNESEKDAMTWHMRKWSAHYGNIAHRISRKNAYAIIADAKRQRREEPEKGYYPPTCIITATDYFNLNEDLPF